jgi:hypothetical protein
MDDGLRAVADPGRRAIGNEPHAGCGHFLPLLVDTVEVTAS